MREHCFFHASQHNKTPEADLAISTEPAFACSAPTPRGRSAAKQLRRTLARLCSNRCRNWLHCSAL